MKKTEVYVEMLKIYKELIIKYYVTGLSAKETHQLYVDYLKEYIKTTSNHPVFENNPKKYFNCNCYCYALELVLPKRFSDIYVDLQKENFAHNDGFVSFSKFTTNKEKSLKNIYADLTTLDIHYYDSTPNTPNLHGGYKIAIYYDSPSKKDGAFHVARENTDGTWSEKVGYTNIIRKFNHLEDSYYCRKTYPKKYEVYKVLEIVKPVAIII